MNVAVCVKQIPDPAVPGSLSADHTLDRSGKLILDESDSYGVEMALQLVDAAGGGEVTLISMAPNDEVSGLRTALAMGAAKAILVSDPALAGSDALSTAQGAERRTYADSARLVPNTLKRRVQCARLAPDVPFDRIRTVPNLGHDPQDWPGAQTQEP